MNRSRCIIISRDDRPLDRILALIPAVTIARKRGVIDRQFGSRLRISSSSSYTGLSLQKNFYYD